MAVSYKKLWHLLLDMNISKVGLQKIAGISDYSVRKLSKNEDVSTEVLTKICTALNCSVTDIVDFLPENISPAGENEEVATSNGNIQ